MPVLLGGELVELPVVLTVPPGWCAHLVAWGIEDQIVNAYIDGALKLSRRGNYFCDEIPCRGDVPSTLTIALTALPDVVTSAEADFLARSLATLHRDYPTLGSTEAASLASQCATTAEMQALSPLILSFCPDISAFHDADGFRCVAKKNKASSNNHQTSLCGRCPAVYPPGQPLTMEDLANQGHINTTWLQSAASYSTVMRYFQRFKDEFSWSTLQPQTTITIQS